MASKLRDIIASGQAPGVFSLDSCEAFRSHADGRYYTSKKKYRAELKARNFVELGNEQVKPKPFKAIDLKPTLHQTLKDIKR